MISLRGRRRKGKERGTTSAWSMRRSDAGGWRWLSSLSTACHAGYTMMNYFFSLDSLLRVTFINNWRALTMNKTSLLSIGFKKIEVHVRVSPQTHQAKSSISQVQVVMLISLSYSSPLKQQSPDLRRSNTICWPNKQCPSARWNNTNKQWSEFYSFSDANATIWLVEQPYIISH